jgi:hypothetical protein
MNDMDTEREIKIVTIEVIEHSFDYNRLIDYLTKTYKKKFKIHSKQKLNLSGIGSKRPTDQEILQVLDLAQCELREMLKRNKYMGSTALFAVDNLYEVLKAACASGGEGKGVWVDDTCSCCGEKGAVYTYCRYCDNDE